MNRVVGIETEFGCLVRDESIGHPEDVVAAIKDHAFNVKRLGLIDLHARSYAFEPAFCGGFLCNGGRLYVDAVGDHLEYATPECTSLRDLVAHERAGHRLIVALLEDMGLREAVSIYNNSIDHFGGHTFGCHENYSVRLSSINMRATLPALISFLVTRQIFAGAGRVGGHRLNHNSLKNSIMEWSFHETDTLWISNIYGVEIDNSVDFQLSQRADHIIHAVSGQVRFNRAIINPKRESAYENQDFWRLHVLFGEANPSQVATALKVGTTSLVLDLAECGLLPPRLWIVNPVHTLKSISRDPERRWLVETLDGKTMGAIDFQRQYLAAAKEHLSGRDEETDWVLAEWERVLDALERDPEQARDCVDWVAKRRLIELYCQAEGVGWHDDACYSLDLEYHNLDPKQSLHAALLEQGEMRALVNEEEIAAAMDEPPADTRARGRGYAIRELLERGCAQYVIDWDAIFVRGGLHLPLPDPTDPAVQQVKRFFEIYDEASQPMEDEDLMI